MSLIPKMQKFNIRETIPTICAPTSIKFKESRRSKNQSIKNSSFDLSINLSKNTRSPYEKKTSGMLIKGKNKFLPKLSSLP
jgi:hypothetical protein